jgi:hypothetical protein
MTDETGWLNEVLSRRHQPRPPEPAEEPGIPDFDSGVRTPAPRNRQDLWIGRAR